jgi:hypothetical protein
VNRYVPDRKWWASGLAGLLSYGLIRAFGVGEGDAAQLAAGLMLAVHYFVPQSFADKLKHLDNDIRSVVKQGG